MLTTINRMLGINVAPHYCRTEQKTQPHTGTCNPVSIKVPAACGTRKLRKSLLRRLLGCVVPTQLGLLDVSNRVTDFAAVETHCA